MTNVNDIMNEMIQSQSSVNRFAKKDAVATEAYLKAKAALNEEATKNWHDPAWHRDVAAVVSARLDWTFYFDNLFASFIDTQTVGEFDMGPVEEEFDGVQAFWTARGAYIDETEMKTKRFTMGRDTIGFHVKEFSDKLRANFANSMESMINLGYQAMDAQINKRLFDTFQTAVGVSSDYYVAATAGLTKDILDEAITDVEDQIRPKNGVYPPITIMGRRAAINQISKVVTGPDGFDPEGNAEIRQQGRLGNYRGANIQVLHNYYDVNRASILPSNELWVFGGTVGKLVFYGGTQTNTWNENTVDYTHYRARRDVGMAIWHPEFSRRIVITEESS